MNLAAPNRPQAPFGMRQAEVIGRREVGPYVVLTTLDGLGPKPVAGQFYMVRSVDGWGAGEDGRPYLPRALSYARCVERDDGLALDFFFEGVGPGTRRLAGIETGRHVVLTGPFGNGFALDPARWPLLVAGGIGLAPIVALDDELRELDGVRAEVLIGMRSAAHAESIAIYGLEHDLATDDGSAGRAGFVTELLTEAIDRRADSTVYACGPPAMLESVRAVCAERGTPAQLAMESGMACGFGACFGCVVPTKDGYQRLCVDGPVVDAARLDTAITVGGH